MGISSGIGLGIAGIAGLGGAALQSSAAKSAASTQAAAGLYSANLNYATAQQAQQIIQAIYQSNKGILQPFVSAGYGGTAALQGMAGLGPNITGAPLLSTLTQPFQPTMAQLAGTPGYQFALQQGLYGVDFQNAAMGLGGVTGAGITGGTGGRGAAAGPAPGAVPSGPLGKALANYATAAASTVYQQQFQNYLTQNQQIYNMLAGAYGGLASQGVGAAGALAGAGTTSAGQQANALLTGSGQYGAYSTGAAAAQAAGQVGSASALSGGLGTLGQLALFNAIAQTPSSPTSVVGGAGPIGVPTF